MENMKVEDHDTIKSGGKTMKREYTIVDENNNKFVVNDTDIKKHLQDHGGNSMKLFDADGTLLKFIKKTADGKIHDMI